jgi:S1-C subfamily serine protease
LRDLRGGSGSWQLTDKALTLVVGGKKVHFRTVILPGVYEATVGGKRVRIVSRASEVIAVEDGKKAMPASDLTAAHALEKGPVQISIGPKHTTLLVHQGQELRILDADGIRVLKTLKLKEPYFKVFARSRCCVGISKEEVHLIDKNTGAVTKKIKVDMVKPLDAVIHPKLTKTYIAAINPDAKNAKDMSAKRVYVVDESSGKVEMVPRVLAERLVIDPSGTYLFASVSDMYEKGERYHINPYGPRLQILTSKEYGYIDILAGFDVRSGSPKFVGANTRPGEKGIGLVISPDGKSVSYISRGGWGSARYPGWENIPAFGAGKLKKAVGAYRVAGTGRPRAIAYHPRLPIVAAGGDKFLFFDRATSKRIVARLDLRDRQLSKWGKMIFSPRGMHMLVECVDGKGIRAFRAFPLKLTAEEAKKLRGKITVPVVPAPGPPDGPGKDVSSTKPVKLADLDGLAGAALAQTSAKEIAEKYRNAVVVIKSGKSSGTGFFVGSKGYVLTCAHVLTKTGKPAVYYNVKAGSGTMRIQAAAEVLRVDRGHDLALLKVETLKAVPVVRIEKATAKATAMGEKVSLIGHPGLGTKILDYTMTTGVVSNPKREIEGVPHIQTSASVNRGCSGAPLFNARGNVVGLVVLKAKLEGVAFAVPRNTLEKFLRAATKKE